jgi:hypothetical protein
MKKMKDEESHSAIESIQDVGKQLKVPKII